MCQACDGINSYQDQPGQLSCKAVSTSCPAGFELSAAATPSSNIVVSFNVALKEVLLSDGSLRSVPQLAPAAISRPAVICNAQPVRLCALRDSIWFLALPIKLLRQRTRSVCRAPLASTSQMRTGQRHVYPCRRRAQPMSSFSTLVQPLRTLRARHALCAPMPPTSSNLAVGSRTLSVRLA